MQERRHRSPVDETKIVHRFNGQYTFRHVELCHVLGECIILDQPAGISLDIWKQS